MDDLELDRRIRAALAELEPQDLELPRPEMIRRRATGRRRRLRWTPVVALAAATALIAGLLYVRSGSGTALRTASPPGPSPTEGSATVADLAAGHWSQLPPDPVASPSAMIWAGSELLAWGNTTGSPPVTVDFTKGAAYQPSSQQWKAIAPAPFPVPQGHWIWTGTEVLFLGSTAGGKGSDAASYSPRSDRWRRLPRSPLKSGTEVAVWTGARVMAFGTIGTGSGAPAGVASYDPSTNRWTTIALPKPPVEHGIRWESAVAIGGSVLAWSGWQITDTGGPALAGDGTDLYAYDEATGRWSLRRPTGTPLPAAYSEFWTGSAVLVDGPAIDCSNCGPGGPPVADVVGSYDPAGNRWIPVPTVMSPPGFTWVDPSLVWTGGALVAIGNGNPSPVRGYDPATNQWQDLPSMPGQYCPGAHLWTGDQLIWSCNGVALALTPATPAIPSPPPTGASPLPPGPLAARPSS